MKMLRRAALAALVGGLFLGGVSTVAADDGTVFSGCITNRTDSTVTLDTSAKEHITIDTTWLKGDMRDTLLADCVTVQTTMIDGKYMAESVEEGDQPGDHRNASNTSSKDDDGDHDSNSGGKNDGD